MQIHRDFNTLVETVTVSSVLSLVVHLRLCLEVEAFLLFHPHGCIQTSTLQQLLMSEQNRIRKKTKKRVDGEQAIRMSKNCIKKKLLRLKYFMQSQQFACLAIKLMLLGLRKQTGSKRWSPVSYSLFNADLQPVGGTFSHCEIHSFVHFLRWSHTNVH